MFLLVDNSDSPSIVEQLQTRTWFWLLYLYQQKFPGSIMYLMPYACQLASCSMHISCYASCSCSISSHSSCSSSLLLLPSQLGFCSPFYPGCFLVEPWDSLSDYVHPGIACLAFWASDWAGAFWGSLSGFMISHLLFGSLQAWPLWSWSWLVTTVSAWVDNLITLASTHWLIILFEGLIMYWWLCPSTLLQWL